MRKEERLPATLRIKIFLRENDSRCESACTLEISRNGVRMNRINGIEAVGQCVWLQRENRRARYRVVWLGEPGTDQQGQAGLELVDLDNVIW